MVYLPHWPIPATFGNRKIDYETVFTRANIVLKRLGNIHLELPPIIHITGTNGKGSTASLIANIFHQAGYKVDLYSSPHLHHCNERITLSQNGIMTKISDNFLYEVIEEVRLAAADVPLSFMEAFTIAAFIAFAKNKADLLVMEVGMGGRIDITNIINNKIATIITPISLDHQQYLGDKLAQIAYEKSLICRKDIPLIIAPQPQPALEMIELIANDQKARPYIFDKDFSFCLIEDGRVIDEKRIEDFAVEFYHQDLSRIRDFIILPQPNLLGEFQYINFTTAIAACNILDEKFPVNDDDIKNAVATVEWPSRLEKITNNLHKFLINNQSISDNNNDGNIITSEIWIDGAHNQGGAIVIANWFLQRNNDGRFKNIAIIGFSRGKASIEFMLPIAKTALLIAVTVEGEPYPEKSENIYQIAKEYDRNIDIIDCGNIEEALKFIIKNFYHQRVNIVICGSLHLARDVKKLNSEIKYNYIRKYF